MDSTVRGTIIKVPDATPGIILARNEQKKFVLDGIWKSETAPLINMVVDIILNSDGVIKAVTAVDQVQEKVIEIGDKVNVTAQGAAEIAVGLAAKMGPFTLGASIALILIWFFLPAWSMTSTGQYWGIQSAGQSAVFTFWSGLMLTAESTQNASGTISFLNFLSILCMAAPFAAPFVRYPFAKFLNLAPLIGFAVCADYLPQLCNTVAIKANEALNPTASGPLGTLGAATSFQITTSFEYGWYLAGVAAIIIAARAFKRGA